MGFVNLSCYKLDLIYLILWANVTFGDLLKEQKGMLLKLDFDFLEFT